MFGLLDLARILVLPPSDPAEISQHATDDLIDDLLDAWTHVLDATSSEGADYATAQAFMVGWIELQHPMTHGAIHRLLKNLWP
jgi:hypothetical protein